MGGGGEDSGTWGRLWISEFSLLNHYRDHRSNTGARSPDHYRRMARNLARSNERGIHQFVRLENLSTYRYNSRTNQLVIVSSNGRLVTYYHPRTGRQYWEGLRRRYGIPE